MVWKHYSHVYFKTLRDREQVVDRNSKQLHISFNINIIKFSSVKGFKNVGEIPHNKFTNSAREKLAK